jgi:integrase
MTRGTRRATVLALLEVAPRAAMDFMGWSNPDMMLRYQHVTDVMRREIAKRLDEHLWTSNPSADSGTASA